MALTYTLPDPMTNGWLFDNYPDLHANLFGICVTTMDVGIRTINGKWYDRIREQIDSDTQRPAIHWGDDTDKTLAFYAEVLTVLYGMTTNASTKTAKEWKAQLNGN